MSSQRASGGGGGGGGGSSATTKKKKDDSNNRRESAGGGGDMSEDEAVRQQNIERLELRIKYRDFFAKFQGEEGGLHQNNSLDDLRKVVNEYFGKVTHTRELQMDADAVNKMVRMLYEQSKKLKDISKQYAIDDFIMSINTKYRVHDNRTQSTGFNWSTLGQHVSATVFDEVYSLETMTGPLHRERKERKERVAKVYDDDDGKRNKGLEKAIVINNDDIDEKDESSNKRVVNLSTNLRVMTQHSIEFSQLSQGSKSSSSNNNNSETQETVDVLKFLVDREDCIQTIENLFDFSFLLKEKHAMLTCDPNSSLPTTMHCSESHFVDRGNNQLVMTVNMKKLRRINELLTKLDQIEHFSTPPEDSASNNAADSSKRPKNATTTATAPAATQPSASSLSLKYMSLHRTDDIYSQVPGQESSSRRNSVAPHPTSALRSPAKNGPSKSGMPGRNKASDTAVSEKTSAGNKRKL